MTDNNFTSEFRAWLARRGLTHAQAADALGVSRRTVESWAQGKPCGTPGLVLRAIALIDRASGAAVWNDSRVKSLIAENRQLRETIARHTPSAFKS